MFVVDTGASTTLIRISDEEYANMPEKAYTANTVVTPLDDDDVSGAVFVKRRGEVKMQIGGVAFTSAALFAAHSGWNVKPGAR